MELQLDIVQRMYRNYAVSHTKYTSARCGQTVIFKQNTI